ncbi:MAG: NigD-like C-terminal domain-containing protein [Prevotellaceae bacterium]|nr:NigD-like protein [Prevotella sp.]MDD7256837.1 NigD-like C-terminal domain-containing protein [Prevotellaceae bacterium]MDY6131660.1 NigD-like C-terminal domain-containing protein [Prevotella sp.]
MRTNGRHIRAFLLTGVWLIVFGGLAACTHEDYETGDGKWSYMRADFVDAYTNGNALLASAMTDDGDTLVFEKEWKTAWKTDPYSVYRALLYYNKVGNRIEPLSASMVVVPFIAPVSKVEGGVKTDPVKLESAWIGKNQRYVNVGISLKTGQQGNDAKRQLVGIVCDTILVRGDGSRSIHLRLYHDQNGVPEHYSSPLYLSIPVKQLLHKAEKGDEVMLTIQTYDGNVTKTLAF